MNNEKKSKDYITEALFQLMDKKDYKSITITDITGRAGVNRVTFYRNFNSKEEIIKRYLDVILKDWGKEWEENKDTNIAYRIFKFFDEQRRIIDLLYKANLQLFLADGILAACGYSKDDDDIIAYSKSTVAYLIFGWCNEWYLRGMKQTPEEMAALFEQGKNTDKQN